MPVALDLMCCVSIVPPSTTRSSIDFLWKHPTGLSGRDSKMDLGVGGLLFCKRVDVTVQTTKYTLRSTLAPHIFFSLDSCKSQE